MEINHNKRKTPNFTVSRDDGVIRIFSEKIDKDKKPMSVRTLYQCCVCGHLWQPRNKFYKKYDEFPIRCANYLCKSKEWHNVSTD